MALGGTAAPTDRCLGPDPALPGEVSSGPSVSLLSFPGPAAWGPWGGSPRVTTTAPGGVAR